MLNFFKQNTKTNVISKNKWLENYDERFFFVKFTNVSDPLDPHSLWSHKIGDKQTIETNTNSNKNRLIDALNIHRCTVIKKNEKGWTQKNCAIFTDVVVLISDKVWGRYSQTGGLEIQHCKETLEKLHKKDFGENLWDKNRNPSYVVMPEASLNQDEVIVQFGKGVFVPGNDDKLIGNLHLRLNNNNWYSIPDWIFWEDGKMRKKPSGLYQNQRFLILGPNASKSSVFILQNSKQPLWFDHQEGRIFLNLYSEDSLRAYGDGKFVSHGKTFSMDKNDNAAICLFEDKSFDPESQDELQKIFLKISPFQTKQKIDNEKKSKKKLNEKFEKIDNDLNKPEPEQDDILDNYFEPTFRTFIPGETTTDDKPDFNSETFIPGIGQENDRLILTGIALPRIDTRSGKLPGLKQWKIWFDSDGNLIKENISNIKDKTIFEIYAYSDSSKIFYKKLNDNKEKQIKNLPFNLKISNDLSLNFIPVPVPERYSGMVKLFETEQFDLGKSEIIIGRGNSINKEDCPDIDLDILTQRESLIWHQGQNRGGNISKLGLSRLHVNVAVENNKLNVSMNKNGKVNIYGLDKDFNLKKELKPDDSSQIILNSGEHILIGSYVLTFECAL